MRHLRFALPVLAFLLLSILIMPQASANDIYNANTYSNFQFVAIQSNQSGVMTEVQNWTSGMSGASPFPFSYLSSAGTHFNITDFQVHVRQNGWTGNQQGLHATVKVYDNGALVNSNTPAKVSVPGGVAGINITYHLTYNFTTVYGHSYNVVVRYWFTEYWGSTLLDETCNITISQPIPTVNSVTLQSAAYHHYGVSDLFGWGSELVSSWGASPNYRVVYQGAHSSMNGMTASLLVLANETCSLLTDIVVMDGTTNISYFSNTSSVTPGVQTIVIGDVQGANLGIVTVTGHIYYITIGYRYLDANGTVVDVGHFSVMVCEIPVPSVYYNWINGIIYLVGMFGPAVLLGRVVPKYGVYIGIIMMSIVIVILVPNFIGVTFVTLIIGGMLLYLGRD
jgi:hypothetical protein